MPKTLPYQEGSVFGVPLRSGAYARGVVARMAPKGKLLLGYFFGPRVSETDLILEKFNPKDACLVGRFGDLHLWDKKWKIIGLMPGWVHDDWHIPEFLKRDPLGFLPDRVVVYQDTDIGAQPRWEQRSSIPAGLKEDGLMGAGFVEIKLDNLLGA